MGAENVDVSTYMAYRNIDRNVENVNALQIKCVVWDCTRRASTEQKSPALCFVVVLFYSLFSTYEK